MAVLHIQNLKKSYRTPEGVRQTIIDVPAFAMEAGEQTALMGSSGSGKTTLLNLIAGILRPDAGSITLDGVNMSGLSEAGRDRLRARTIGYVFQTFNLLQGYSALENVMLGMMFGGRVDRDHAASLLDRMGLGDRRSYNPSALSVGQQQRVAVARALANRPKLVIADEPTGNLDPQRAADALKLIRSVCEENGAALLLVSHDRHLIEQFDRVQALDEINGAAGAAEAAS